ncbi:SCO family protein [Deinococcus radiophilus]|uniref:SCO family protein n=1 Tax=Deinococcus radiophilus TaxID=32062 RepID=A0A431W4E4_9DEIO|nr:SCO family protein [Deinococcus radiophilus]RTR30331.1 SCO family protein [Deinococcus radiophilus]UFA49870.1 SCO family protein [Deinococcus radiophilus]
MKWLTPVLLLIAAVLAGLLFLRQTDPQPQYGTALADPKPLPALTLLSDQDQPAALNDSQGKLRLIFYGFVRCPDVCPTTLGVLSSQYSALPADLQDKVLVQLVSVDPVHDRPAVLREYLNRFDDRFVGLTGETASIDEAARSMFVGITRLPTAEATDHSAHMSANTETAQSGASVDTGAAPPQESAAEAAMIHSDQVSVVDIQGNFVRVYGNQAVASGQLAQDLPALVAQYGPQ